MERGEGLTVKLTAKWIKNRRSMPALFLACLCSAAPAPGWARTVGFSIDESASTDGSLVAEALDEDTLAPLSDAQVSYQAPEQALTVSKAGYVTVSLIGITKGKITVYLKKNGMSSAQVVASGTLGGWQPPAGSSAIGGLVFRSLSATELLGFDLGSFVSPLRDTINVFGPREIPSNAVLPEQNVFLPIGSVRLNKPGYRLPIEADRATQLTGLQAEVKVLDVLPYLRGGKDISVDIVNKLKVTRVGMSSTIQSASDVKEDFDATVPLAAKHQVTITRPPFAADVLSVAATDHYGDRRLLIPTDVKAPMTREAPGRIQTVTLSAPRQAHGFSEMVVSIAAADRGQRISGIVTDRAGRTVQQGPFLDVALLPNYGQLPASVAVKAGATGFAMLSFEAEGSGGARDLHPVWNVFVLPAAGARQVETSGIDPSLAISRYSVTQLEFGGGFDPRQVDGAQVMRGLTRFTRASASRVTGP